MVSVEQKQDISLTIAAAITKVELLLMGLDDDDPNRGDWELVHDELHDANEACRRAQL